MSGFWKTQIHLIILKQSKLTSMFWECRLCVHNRSSIGLSLIVACNKKENVKMLKGSFVWSRYLSPIWYIGGVCSNTYRNIFLKWNNWYCSVEPWKISNRWRVKLKCEYKNEKEYNFSLGLPSPQAIRLPLPHKTSII